MDRLTPRIQHYAWGSHVAMARLTGRPHPTDEPEAELWMGAHEAGPSMISREAGPVPLHEVIARDPAAELGGDVADQFGPRLPFLLKVLAPAQALSIQAHPNAQEAREAAPGTYADGWPKPEALVAVSAFEIFAGTRPFAEASELLRRLGVPRLTELVDAAAATADPAHAILEQLFRLPTSERPALVADVLTACEEIGPGDPDAELVSTVLRISEQHPDDIGPVVLLTMHHQTLRSGEYVFVPAGVLHAYVHGVAVEIMANSDNIVRAGLTPKKIDVEELLRIVDVERQMVPEKGVADDLGWTTFPADTAYFQLRMATLAADAREIPAVGQPRILLALTGEATVRCGDQELMLTAGESCYFPASDGSATVAGDGQVYLATPGL